MWEFFQFVKTLSGLTVEHLVHTTHI